ncbi:MAG: prephenate dehydratase domain-containing protein [Peptococcaceae bacterium]|jgi:prephenate dehydratase|nr:hypothetical protein [Peptococcaceae bacterium]MDH7525019.1 prephenate dehydratase domain-containing protein [Peptococcaceae bacterium]
MKSKKKIVISTLGPRGTCSEYTAQYYMDKNGLTGEIRLYSTFEEAIDVLKRGESDLALVPSAYQNFAKLLFENFDSIKIVNTFVYETPRLVIGSKKPVVTDIKKIATHPAPSSWVKRYYPDAEIIFAESNSRAALMVAEGEVDVCMTNYICVEEYGLNVIKDCGPIMMSWNVFERIKTASPVQAAK